MPQRLPNFFVLDVQKCGTTTIADRAFDMLRESFVPEVDALRKLIDRPLESWLQH